MPFKKVHDFFLSNNFDDDFLSSSISCHLWYLYGTLLLAWMIVLNIYAYAVTCRPRRVQVESSHYWCDLYNEKWFSNQKKYLLKHL